jgi:hypothetical protein
MGNIMRGTEFWEQYVQDAVHEDDLFVGLRNGDTRYLTAAISDTVATNQMTGQRIRQGAHVYATDSLDVAKFVGSVWSRDGWSGWHSYLDAETDEPYFDFFAAPRVIAAAFKIGGFVARVSRDGFRPGYFPGEYISDTTVAIKGVPQAASIRDIGARILESPYLPPDPERRASERATGIRPEEYYASLGPDLWPERPHGCALRGEAYPGHLVEGVVYRSYAHAGV